MTLRGRTTSKKKWTLAGKPSSPGEVREFVFDRDGRCMAAAFEEKLRTPLLDRHVCGSAFGPTQGGGLTFEHVTRVHGEEGRKNDERHGVALCGTLNGETMTLANRDMKDHFREYLRDLYPECSTE